MNSPAGHWGARPARSGSWSPVQSSPEPWPCTRRPAERHPPSLLALALCCQKAVPTSCEAGGSGTAWQETPPVAGRGSAPVGQASISPWTVGGAASAGREGKPTPGQVGRYLSTVQYGRAQCRLATRGRFVLGTTSHLGAGHAPPPACPLRLCGRSCPLGRPAAACAHPIPPAGAPAGLRVWHEAPRAPPPRSPAQPRGSSPGPRLHLQSSFLRPLSSPSGRCP